MAHSIAAKPPPVPNSDGNIKELRSFDKLFLADEGQGASVTLVFHYKAKLNAQSLLEANAARAFKELSIKHARMRILLCKDASGLEDYQFSVLNEITDAAVTSSIKVQRGNWKTMVMAVADTGFPDRSDLPLFNITIIPPDDNESSDGEGHIIFNASHAIQDGMGALIFASDFFAAVSKGLDDEPSVMQEDDEKIKKNKSEKKNDGPCQLLPDLFELVAGPPHAQTLFVLPAPEAIIRDMILPAAVEVMMGTPPSCMPVHKSIPIFDNSTTAHSVKPLSRTLFVSANGNASRFVASRTRVKEEKTTLNGAYTAAFAVAYSRVLESMDKVPGKTTCPLTFCFNMRIPGRTGSDPTTQLPSSSVGNYFNFASVRPLQAGLALDSAFWGVSRDVNSSGEEDISSDMSKYMIKFFDGAVTRDENSRWLKIIPGGVRDGFVMSNMGNYNGPSEIVFPDSSTLSLTSFHTHASFNGPTCASVSWMSTCNGKPTYSSAHKLDSDIYERFFNNWVKVCESLGSIGANETVGSVADRLLGPQYYLSAP